jgi:hypothetical protein
MALKLNAVVARGLHGKKMDFSADDCIYDIRSNPLVGF